MEKTTRCQRIATILTEHLQPTKLDIRDDSAGHSEHGNVPAGATETHLHITIQSEQLTDKNRVEQHRAVMELIKDEFETGLHALQIEVVRN